MKPRPLRLPASTSRSGARRSDRRGYNSIRDRATKTCARRDEYRERRVISVFADRDSFEDEAFADLDLSRADISNREFLRCTFINVQLPDADLSGARFD